MVSIRRESRVAEQQATAQPLVRMLAAAALLVKSVRLPPPDAAGAVGSRPKRAKQSKLNGWLYTAQSSL